MFHKTEGKFTINASDETGGKNNLTNKQKDTINRVIEYYGKYDAQWLSQLTIMEEPWINARKGVLSGANCNNVITKESMALYYGKL